MKVLVVNGNGQYEQLVSKSVCMELATSYEEADTIMFTGGSDVSPRLYGEDTHPRTMANRLRDEQEVGIYTKALLDGKKFIGICRGAQFLNVVNGGTLFQHVDNHAIGGTHTAYTEDGRSLQVTSTHHQMMRPTPFGNVLAHADCLSESRQHMYKGKVNTSYNAVPDTEVVWYDKTNSLCFQPHPEFNGSHVDECRAYFYELVESLLC